jgi:hypothetical protein
MPAIVGSGKGRPEASGRLPGARLIGYTAWAIRLEVGHPEGGAPTTARRHIVVNSIS